MFSLSNSSHAVSFLGAALYHKSCTTGIYCLSKDTSSLYTSPYLASPENRKLTLLAHVIVTRPLCDTLTTIICNYSHKDDVLMSLILCCSSSESSSQALSVFNKVGLLDVVVPCLERHPQNVELAISAGRLKQCTVNGLDAQQIFWHVSSMLAEKSRVLIICCIPLRESCYCACWFTDT